MSERSLAIGFDTPSPQARPSLTEVNPFSLIEAVNSTSEIAHTGWLIFLGVVAYFCIATAGVTHKDLLLNSAVQLPVLQVSVDLTRFFLFAPIVLVFMHFGLLVQHVMLARKVMEFDAAVRDMEPTHRRTHPIRHELHSYFFTQALAGPERSKLFGGFLHGMFWLSIIGIPVLVILFIQIVYLPYHDVTTTWSHRLALVLDTVILGLMGAFLGSRSSSFFGALSRMVRNQPLNVLATVILYLGVVLFSFFVATVPDEPLDRFTQTLPWSSVKTTTTADGQVASRRVFAVTDWLFEGLGRGSKLSTSPFRRNLSVTDEVVVDRRTVLANKGQAIVSLRDRDLRYAELDRSDLELADFTGADLRGARLVGTNLKGARLSCLDIDVVLTEPTLRAGSCANLSSANFARADLSGADLRFAYVSGANFENAVLKNTDLRYADLTGANLSGADLRGASLGGGIELMGANFLGANLNGADLKGARLQGSDFYGADLKGARLVFAQAQGANFQGAHLEGANLSAARLQGADFTDADATAADFGAAIIWNTKPPATRQVSLADLGGIVIKPLEPKDVTSLKDLRKTVKLARVQDKLDKLIARVESADEGSNWNAGDEATAWAGMKQAAVTTDQTQRVEKMVTFLGKLSCSANQSDGSVAIGLIRRIVDTPKKSNPAAMLRRLRAPDCPAAKHLPESVLLELEATTERAASVVADVAAAPQPAAPAADATAAAVVVPAQ